MNSIFKYMKRIIVLFFILFKAICTVFSASLIEAGVYLVTAWNKNNVNKYSEFDFQLSI